MFGRIHRGKKGTEEKRLNEFIDLNLFFLAMIARSYVS